MTFDRKTSNSFDTDAKRTETLISRENANRHTPGNAWISYNDNRENIV